MQIAKMMSTPMVMPATTVTSAPVKEEDLGANSFGSRIGLGVQGATLSMISRARWPK